MRLWPVSQTVTSFWILNSSPCLYARALPFDGVAAAQSPLFANIKIAFTIPMSGAMLSAHERIRTIKLSQSSIKSEPFELQTNKSPILKGIQGSQLKVTHYMAKCIGGQKWHK